MPWLVWTKQDVSPKESCGYEEPQNDQMLDRSVTPNLGDSNPLFKNAVPDSSRYGPDAATPASQRDGEKRMIARVLLAGGANDNATWGYCKVHRCIVYLNVSGDSWTDWTMAKHQTGELPYPHRASIPAEPCQISSFRLQELDR